MPKQIEAQPTSKENHPSTAPVWKAVEGMNEKNPQLDVRTAVTTILEAFGVNVNSTQKPPKQ